MNIQCQIVEVSDPHKLPKESLPEEGLLLENPGRVICHRDVFVAIIETFNATGDTLIDDVFFPLLGNRLFLIPVVITHGVPAPYDAWCTVYHGKKAFFFNLSDWSGDDLKHSGIAVVKHEITHVLLAELLKKPDDNNPIDVLNEMIINEGIAHFVGYPRDRSTLLSDKTPAFERAEEQLRIALLKLSDPNTDKAESQEILKQGCTGKYWEKYAAIAGMYRTALLFAQHGAKGIIDAIHAGHLPTP